MPFGLKNAPSEIQRIMNDIFNVYSKFCIVYFDDVLIFSHSIDQHFKHLHIFFHIVKQNGLVVSKKKISLFQTRVCFLGHCICQGIVTPIKRSLSFTTKFPDKITNKTQLQRFLGSFNYVLDYFLNISRLAKPLYEQEREASGVVREAVLSRVCVLPSLCTIFILLLLSSSSKCSFFGHYDKIKVQIFKSSFHRG